MDEATHERIVKRYWDLREQVRSDPEFARLRRELEALEPEYEAIFSALPEPEQQILDRYITLRENRNLRMAEYACEENRSCRADGIASADQVG